MTEENNTEEMTECVENEQEEPKTQRLTAKSGKVQEVFFGLETHGVLTMFLAVNTGNAVQSFGGLALDSARETEKGVVREGSAVGTDFVLEMLNLFGVQQVSDIEGKVVDLLIDDNNKLVGLKSPDFETGRTFFLPMWLGKCKDRGWVSSSESEQEQEEE